MPYQGPRVPIGQRREKVQLLEAQTTDDGMGGQTVTRWKTIGEPWAAVQPLDERTKEALMGAQITARHAYHITIPYRIGLTPQMRLVWRNQTLEIHTVTDDEQRRRRLILQCAEVQTAGA